MTFRPDYRYVGRFIREKAGEEPVPPVLCLTATAKPDVVDEIVDFFRQELAIELEVFDGGARRTNLEFVVVKTGVGEKFAHVHQVLTADLPEDEPGGAIVYCATRSHTEELAEFLQAKGMKADHFHAGLPPETKKSVQENFINGGLRAIVATNAFGMGIDKPDVRLVVHADIPGSLENYLQEAGRAGRDQQAARCVSALYPGGRGAPVRHVCPFPADAAGDSGRSQGSAEPGPEETDGRRGDCHLRGDSDRRRGQRFRAGFRH